MTATRLDTARNESQSELGDLGPSGQDSRALDPEVARLIEAASSSQGRDSIGYQATAELLRRGFPDALLVPPEALEAYRDANTPRRLWIPFVVHYAPIALVLSGFVMASIYGLLSSVTAPVGDGQGMQFIIREDVRLPSMSDFLWSLASGGWIALGALAAFAPPQSRRRRGAAFLVGLAWLLAVLACAVDAGPFRGFVASIDDFGDAVALTLRSAWLLAPAFLAYRSLRGDR